MPALARGFAVAAALLLGAELAVRSALPRVEPYDLRALSWVFRKLPLYGEAGGADLAFFGTSRSDQGLRPDLFKGAVIDGLTVRRPLNDAADFGMPNLWMSVRGALGSGAPAPKVAFVELAPCALSKNYPNPMFEYLGFRDGLRFSAVARQPPVAWDWFVGFAEHHGLDRASRLYRYRQAVEYAAYSFLGRLGAHAAELPARALATRASMPYREDGYAMLMPPPQRTLAEQPEELANVDSHGCRDFKMDHGRRRLFEDAVDQLRAAGARVELLELPVSSALEARMYAEGDRERLSRYADDFAAGRGLRLTRLSRQECGLGDADFRDTHHLAPTGAEKLSRCLRKRLEGAPS